MCLGEDDHEEVLVKEDKDKFKFKNQFHLVNQNNVLWTCHKACKIEYGDCDFCICSKCYSTKVCGENTEMPKTSRTVQKRRRHVQCSDDDESVCRHDIDSMKPFMDQTFFTTEFKDTILIEKYKLPMVCSECNSQLVDKIPATAATVVNSDIVAV